MKDLLSWCGELDQKQPHVAVLLASSQVTNHQLNELYPLAKTAFVQVETIRQRTPEERPWPICCNALWRLALSFAKDRGEPFFWNEPDCIPLKSGWVDTLESEYRISSKPFMGHVWNRPLPHLAGCAVYPADVARYNPQAATASNRPWDITRPDLTLPKTHRTALIHHEWGDILHNTPWTFPNAESVKRINPKAVVFHRCKDQTLILRMREARSAPVDPPPKEPFWQDFARKAVRLIRHGSTYYHSGNLGDIIYALYAIKKHGGGDLLIGPEQVNTSPCRVPTTESQFNALKPLLEAAAPYIKSVRFVSRHPNGAVSYDLNTFRNHWNNWPLRKNTGIHSLARMHFYTLGIAHLFNDNEPWLDIPCPTPSNRIIVHRSARYQAPNFPWQELVKRHSGRMLFVGLPEEHSAFERDFGHKVSFYTAADFLDLARVIAGGVAFVGNQSFPNAIALACGQKVFQEVWKQSPDCMFRRGTFLCQNNPSPVAQFEKWL